MNPIVLFDLIFFIASLTALIILLKSWKRTIKRDIKLFFAGLLVFTTGYSFCLVLEWSGITKALDPFEDFLGALLPMWWAFLLYALLQEMVNRDQRESEEKYRNVVERANDGITIIQDGRIKFVNRFLAEMTGRTVEEVTGTYFTDYLHPLEVPKLAERYERRTPVRTLYRDTSPLSGAVTV